MPIYEYHCETCNIHLCLKRRIEERDNIKDIATIHCPHAQEHDKECNLKRVISQTTFIYHG